MTGAISPIPPMNTEVYMSTTDETIEQEIQAKGLTAPRVTPADLQSNIVHTEIVKHISPSGQVLRWAVLTTRNGFAVTGRPSASVSSSNDNAEIGEKVAVENAKQELWPLMGYELRSQLAAEARGDVNHDIGWAVRQAKLGKRVARRGWNAAGQWVTFSPGTENVPADRFWAPANQAYAEENGGYATVFSAMTLKNAQGMIVMGWVPSVTDLLMQDWEIVE